MKKVWIEISIPVEVGSATDRQIAEAIFRTGAPPPSQSWRILPSAPAVAYSTGIAWKPHQSEQIVKLTREPQLEHGFNTALYAEGVAMGAAEPIAVPLAVRDLNLTEQEIFNLAELHTMHGSPMLIGFARAIEFQAQLRTANKLAAPLPLIDEGGTSDKGEEPKWLTTAKERIAATRFGVGSNLHLLEMAVNAYEARPQSSEPMGEKEDKWQPIETAPRDGTPVLISALGHFEAPVVGEARYLEDAGWYWAQCDPSDARGGDVVGPTDWMPLPAAPKDTSDKPEQALGVEG